MLETVRSFATSPLGKAVFIVILIAFAGGFWYVGNPLAPTEQNWALKVGDRPIPPDVVARDYQRELERIGREAGRPISAETARELGLRQRVIGSIVNSTLLDIAASELGLVAGDDLVRETIVANPAFRSPGGGFDRNVYAQALALNGFNETRFEALVREDITRQQLLASMQGGAVAPPALTELYYRVAAERRIVDYITVPSPDPASLPEPDAATLQKVYEERPLLFTAPEYRAITIAEIRVDDVAAEIRVSDDEIGAAYDERAGEFTSPEKRTVRQIVVQDEATARRIHDRLRQGADFATVALEEAGLTPDLLSLGTVARSEMVAEVGAAAFALAPGGVSDPIETLFGWTIVTVDAIEASKLRPLDAVADSLRQDIAREKAAEGVYDLAARLQDSLAAGTPLEQAATALNLRLRQLDAVDGDGKDRSGNAIPDLAPEIVAAAFRTNEGEESLLTDRGDSASFIVRVDRVTARALKPLDDVREQAVVLARQEQAKASARTIADAIAERLRAGTDIATAAAEHGLTAAVTEPFDRNGQGTDLSKLMVEIFFDRPPGEVVVIPFGQVHVVGRVREIVPGEPGTADPATIAALRETLNGQLRGELAEQLLAALRQRHPVLVNDAILNQQF